jgi:hypothetical protein
MEKSLLTIDVVMLISSTMVDGTLSSIDKCDPGHSKQFCKWTGEIINSPVNVDISANNL